MCKEVDHLRLIDEIDVALEGVSHTNETFPCQIANKVIMRIKDNIKTLINEDFMIDTLKRENIKNGCIEIVMNLNEKLETLNFSDIKTEYGVGKIYRLAPIGVKPYLQFDYKNEIKTEKVYSEISLIATVIMKKLNELCRYLPYTFDIKTIVNSKFVGYKIVFHPRKNKEVGNDISFEPMLRKGIKNNVNIKKEVERKKKRENKNLCDFFMIVLSLISLISLLVGSIGCFIGFAMLILVVYIIKLVTSS